MARYVQTNWWAHTDLHPTAVQRLQQGPLRESLVLTLVSDTDAELVALGDQHPADWLTATIAAPDCLGLLVVVPGSIRGSTPPERVVAAHEIRNDGSARFWVGSDNGLISSGCDEGTGLVPDAMQRSLQLSTPPPTDPAGWFWLAVWMADLFVLDPGADVREAARWHPAVDPREIDEVADQALVGFVVERHLDHASVLGWSALRAMSIDSNLELGHIPAVVAAWHDDGSFSRALADQLPSMIDLNEAAHVLLAPSGRQLVDAVVRAVERHG